MARQITASFSNPSHVSTHIQADFLAPSFATAAAGGDRHTHQQVAEEYSSLAVAAEITTDILPEALAHTQTHTPVQK